MTLRKEANQGTPLGDCRILDLTDERGVYCGRLLADLGADVIKVERPEGDSMRNTLPFKDDIPHRERSLPFLYFNANKRGITLNIACADGQAIFQRLVEGADVVIESFPPGTLEAWGLGYSVLRGLNPALILTSITGFGQTGPHHDYKVTDIVGFAVGGTLNRCGSPDRPPCLAAGSLAYDTACMYAAVGTLIALNYRQVSGFGQHVDVSIQEAVAKTDDYSIARFHHQNTIGRRDGSVIGGLVPSGIYPCADGHVRVCVLTPEAWRAFFQWMGSPEALSDPVWEEAAFRGQNRDVVNPYIRDFTKKYTKAELQEEGQKRHIPISPVVTPGDFIHNVHEKKRGFFVEVEHPVAGKGLYAGIPWTFSEIPHHPLRPAPLLGQDNGEIYCGELGFSQEQLVVLRTAGVI